MLKLTEEQIRGFMELSVEVMKSSIQERREDEKPSPFVGAVMVREDKSVVTAYRGELREGDHAEFTLLERKCRSEKVEGNILFATLEPCAPGARHFPKLGCAERIVNARIGKVYIGIEDPDPTVCRKGIQHLLDNGVEVEMYPRDLQAVIEDSNKEFLSAAMERARLAEEEESKEVILSETERGVEKALLQDLSEEQVIAFMEKAKLGDYHSKEGLRELLQLGLIDTKQNDKGETIYVPTGIGLLLFGRKPELVYNNAVIRATYKTEGKKEDIETISGPLVEQPGKIFNWYKDRLGRQIDRSEPGRKYLYDYPIEVINELVKNAILHRDYDIKGAPIYLEINDDAIIIKSPGYAVPPIKLGQIANFNAPSLSRNPKIMFVFDALDLAEQRGLGFMTVRELPEKHDIPLPLVSYEEPYLVFTLPRNAAAVNKVDDTLAELDEGEIRMLNFFRLNDGKAFGKGEVVEKLGIYARTAERELKHLVDLKLLIREGVGRSTVYRIAAQ
jgi:ATP-dependent DNA helicase RecG